MTTTTITRVACPPWCITQAEHMADLDEAFEGWVMHRSATLPLSDEPDGPTVRLTMTATPDGRIVDPEGRLRFDVRVGDGLDDAAMARLHELVDATERGI